MALPISSGTQLDVVFDGTWVMLPRIDENRAVIAVDVYSPACGHPLGVTFTTAFNPEPWPDSTMFFMLDSHGHTLTLQRSVRENGISVDDISKPANHCIAGPRPLGSNWDLHVSIPFAPDAWVSDDTRAPMAYDSFGNYVSCLQGGDAPTGQISSRQTLTFSAVTGLELCGAPSEVNGQFVNNWQGGTLIFENEIPYKPTLRHERDAIFAMASLAGLDLALDYPLSKVAPPPGTPQPRTHTGPFCGYSLIVMP